MKILILDDSRSRREQLKEAAEKLSHEVVACSTSNDFITNVEEFQPQVAAVDIATWKKGKSIYSYFHIGKKLEKIPVILYNTDEDTYFISERKGNEKDRILPKPTDIETIIDSLQDTE